MTESGYAPPQQVYADLHKLFPPPPPMRPPAVPWSDPEVSPVAIPEVPFSVPIPEPTLEELHAAIRPLWMRLDPQIEKMSPGIYRVPLRLARRFVGAGGTLATDLVLKGAGTPHALGFWPRLLELARAAATENRFATLGKLAYLADRSFAVQSLPAGREDVAGLKEAAAGSQLDVPLPPNDCVGQTTAPQAMQALQAFFDYSGRKIQHRPYVVSALSYLLSLPESFLPPADLISRKLKILPSDRSGTASPGVGWNLLRQFWATGYDAWKRHPDAIAKLGEAPNPFVRRLGEVIDASNVPSVPASIFDRPIPVTEPESAWDEIASERATGPSHDQPVKRGGWMSQFQRKFASVFGRKPRQGASGPAPNVTEPREGGSS